MSEEIISKELLSAVLGFPCEPLIEEDDKNTVLIMVEFKSHLISKNHFSRAIGYANGINIYELMHLVKEWALTQGYALMSGYDDGKTFMCECGNINMPIAYGNSEPEAVFKAAQFALDNKGE